MLCAPEGVGSVARPTVSAASPGPCYAWTAPYSCQPRSERTWMSAETFALHVLNGVTFGGLLFLLASGFTLIFGLMRITNLSHGAFYLIGGYVGLSILWLSGSFWLAL